MIRILIIFKTLILLLLIELENLEKSFFKYYYKPIFQSFQKGNRISREQTQNTICFLMIESNYLQIQFWAVRDQVGKTICSEAFQTKNCLPVICDPSIDKLNISSF